MCTVADEAMSRTMSNPLVAHPRISVIVQNLPRTFSIFSTLGRNRFLICSASCGQNVDRQALKNNRIKMLFFLHR